MKEAHEKEDRYPPLLALRLRALVLAIGESVTPAWWKTEFMSETGLRFLERLYPRTAFRAAVHAAGAAACGAHDHAVGRIGVYHLFRLPESLEVEINRFPPGADASFVSAFRASLGSTEKLMEMLASLSGRLKETGESAGAKRIGNAEDLMTPDAFERTAAFYLHAFGRGKPGFPYFAAEQSGGRG